MLGEGMAGLVDPALAGAEQFDRVARRIFEDEPVRGHDLSMSRVSLLALLGLRWGGDRTGREGGAAGRGEGAQDEGSRSGKKEERRMRLRRVAT